jgi:hypothetical protein
MPRTYVYTANESSQISELSYDAEGQTLTLRFRNSPNVRYSYANVSPSQVTDVMFAKSIGSAGSKFTQSRGKDFEKVDVVADHNAPHFGGTDNE